MSIPVSLIIDDGAPVNPMYFLHPLEEHKFIVPNEFTEAFADVCAKYGVKGKFSVMPMPSGLGRIDESLSYVPKRHLQGFISIVKKKIAPLFDITPEILTHQAAYDVKSGRLLHIYEDEWVRRASADEITDYVSLALRILENVGLRAAGVTSPWATGIQNEKTYAEGIGRAFYRVFGKKRSCYFLHCFGNQKPRKPWVTWEDKKRGIKVVTVPALTSDYFWGTQAAAKKSKRAAMKAAMEGVDGHIRRDGKGGRLRELFDAGFPLIMVTHWQSLFSEGTWAGLKGLKETFSRIEKTFGGDVEWMSFSALAKTAY